MKQLLKNNVRVRAGAITDGTFSPKQLSLLSSTQATVQVTDEKLWIEVTNMGKRHAHVHLHDSINIGSPVYDIGPSGSVLFEVTCFRHDQPIMVLAYAVRSLLDGEPTEDPHSPYSDAYYVRLQDDARLADTKYRRIESHAVQYLLFMQVYSDK